MEGYIYKLNCVSTLLAHEAYGTVAAKDTTRSRFVFGAIRVTNHMKKL